jgi:aminomethyltransferase
VHHKKKENFIGKKILLSQKEMGTAKNLYAFVMDERIVPRSGYEIRVGGDQAGWVSSGSFSPYLNASVGLGFIENRKLNPDDRIDIVVRGNLRGARIVKKPFYPYRGGIS